MGTGAANEKEEEAAPILVLLQTPGDITDGAASPSNLSRDDAPEEHANGDFRCKYSPWEVAKDLLRWLALMREAFGAPFLAVVMVVYGVSQGYAETVNRLATNYYWKDVQKMQPVTAQTFAALPSIPWDIKPIYGIITDTFPIAGYQRWPYLAICGVAGCICLWALAIFKLTPWLAVLLMTGVALCTAFPDVVADAAVAQRSKITPELASDLQSLSWGSMAVGSLFGCGVSGAAVHGLGPQGSYVLVSTAPLMLIVAALILPESRLSRALCHFEFKALMHTLRRFGQTLRDPVIWKPALYIYLSQGSLCPDISEAMFFRLTDPVAGPGFSEKFMGFVNAIGYMAMLVGVAGYNCWFRHFTFRKMFLWPQIPDHVFILGDKALTGAISRLQLMPMLVLSAQLCPSGIEGTVFAFLMSVSNFGNTSGSWVGAALLKWLHIQKDDYSRLWLAVLIRSLMRLSPLLFLFLVPDCTVESIRPLSIALSYDSGMEQTAKDMELCAKISVHEAGGEDGEIANI